MAGNTLLNVMGKLLPMVAAVFGIPIIIAGLGVDLFGILILIWIFVGYSTMFDLGLSNGLIKVLADYQSEPDTVKMRAISTTVTILFGIGLVVGLSIALLNSIILNNWLEVDLLYLSDASTSLYIIAGAYPILILYGVFKAVLESNQRFGTINLYNTIYGTLNYLVPAAAVWLGHSLLIVVMLTVMIRLAFTIHLMIAAKRSYPNDRLRLGFDPILYKPLMSFSKWMVLVSLLATGMALADRFIIGSLISLSAISYFSTPLELLMKLDILPISLVAVLFPAFTYATATKSTQTESIYNFVLKLLSLTFGILCFYLILFGEVLLAFWLGAEFAMQSVFVFRVLCASSYLISMVYIAQSLIQGIGRPAASVAVYVILVAIGLPLTYWMILHHDIEGAAFARLFRIMIEFALISYIIHRVAKVAVHSTTVVVVLSGFCCLLMAFFLPSSAILIPITLLFWVLITMAFWNYALTSSERLSILNLMMMPKLLASRFHKSN